MAILKPIAGHLIGEETGRTLFSVTTFYCQWAPFLVTGQRSCAVAFSFCAAFLCRIGSPADRMAKHTLDTHAMAKPAFLITIDTEGDNLWAAPRTITTKNAESLPRFQQLCEKYALIPTYLTDYVMACCPVFREFARDALRRNTAEVGMHLHAWQSPPFDPLTDDDHAYGPYLIDYPEPVMRKKVRYITQLLEDTFERRMISHRAGRWALDGRYARILVECGYQVDCSVTPAVSWKSQSGAPTGSGGADYTSAPAVPYLVDLNDVCRPGDSPLLEVPMTIMRTSPVAVERLRRSFAPRSVPARVLNRLFPPITWLRPNGTNLRPMLRILDLAIAEGSPYVEFMLHSSEFMAGGSPTFRDERSIEVLFDHMERLFAAARNRFRGTGLETFGAEAAAELAPTRRGEIAS
jgi:hypothetical protein